MRSIAPILRVAAALSIVLSLAERTSSAQEEAELVKTYLVVTDRTSNSILRFQTAGEYKDGFVQDPIYIPEAVVFGPDQNLYITSYSTGSVERYNGVTGNYIGRFAGSNSPLRNPEGLAFGPDGNVYVVDRTQSAVLRFDGETGSYIDQFVRPGAAGYNNASGITFGPDGNLYVTSGTQSQGQTGAAANPQILRFDGSTGTLKDVFVATRSGGLEAPFTLIFGPDGNLYVSSVTTNSVLRYNGKSGAFIDAFVPPNRGGLTRPTGMTFGPDGNFYVASSFNPGVGVLRYDGTTGAFIDLFIPSGSGGMGGPTGVLFYPFESRIVRSGISSSVATDPSGKRMLVWTDGDLVKVQPFDASGKSTSSPRTVSDATEKASNPKVIALGASSFLLTWQAAALSSTSSRIMALPLSGSGAPTGSGQQVSVASPAASDVNPTIAAVQHRSRAAIVWGRKDSSGRGTGLVGRIVGTNGSAIGGEISLSSTTSSSDEMPAIASDSENRVVISWRRRRVDGTSTTIVTGGTDGSLSPISNAYVLDDGSAGVPGNPSVSANSQGRAMIAWSRDNASTAKVLLVPIAMTSVPSGSFITMNGDAKRGATGPQVGISEAGNAGVVWQYNGLFGGTGIYGRTLDAGGVAGKTEFVVTDAAHGGETFSAPAVALDTYGTMTISSQKTIAGSAAGIFTRTRAPVTSRTSRRRVVKSSTDDEEAIPALPLAIVSWHERQ